MKYLHTMVRVKDLQSSLYFYCELLGLKESIRKDFEQGRFTLLFLADDDGQEMLELTYNWDNTDNYDFGRNFGHLAYQVNNIYQTCEHLQNNGVTILRPPRDGRMAFIKSPDNISIELLQKGEKLEGQEPWLSMKNTGSW